MLKFITGRRTYTPERAKIIKELFSFSRTVSHGFPHNPSCLAYDEELSLICICTKGGAVKVFGAPGVEFVGYHRHEGVISQAHFIPGQGRLVTLHENNELCLWEICDTQLELVGSIEKFEKRIFSFCVTPNKKEALVGTEQGDVLLLDLENFKFTDSVIKRDLITEKVPEDFKVSPGGVECIRCLSQELCVVGYQRGILVLFDLAKLSARQTYMSRKDLSNVYVIDDSKFVSCHTDGGYLVWSTILSSSTKQVDQIYGPHSCKSVDKLYAFDNERTLIFSGGMPRSQYGDRYTLSVHRGPIERKVFEFTSKVIDFYVVHKKVVIVLAEEELVAISLQDLKPIQLPYLFPLHCSAITNVIHSPNVPQEIVEKLTDEVNRSEWSTTKWPINGGKVGEDIVESGSADLILTGHEDGSVRIYDATSVAMKLLSCIKTTSIFNERCHESRAGENDPEEFLQLTKVGTFDPYSDDPRFAVKKLAFHAASGTLVIGGTAGQVLVLGFEPKSVDPIALNLVGDRDSFVWKGHEALTYDSSSSLNNRYVVRSVIQVSPPASVTALAIQENWNLVAAGTAHGFGCVDLSTEQVVMFKCTLDVSDLGGTTHSGDMVRRKSFKKSLRESFRRLRKGRSQRGKTAKNIEDVKPVERQVESRIMQDDGMSSMVRSLVFSEAYVFSATNTSRSFWASTNSGSVFLYVIKKTEDSTTLTLCKEILLKHHAPVLGVFVVDSHGFLCHDGPPKESGSQNLWRVVICSEEQMKVFSLPQIKPLHKVKLTANEGSRIRKLQVAEFKNSSRSEHCLIAMTNQGQVLVFSLPDLRRIMTADCCRKDDINGISSTVFTNLGEGFYLNSASELDRVSVSATKITAPTGVLDLPEGARPKRKQPTPKKEEPVKEKEIVAAKEVVKERRSSSSEKRRSSSADRKESKSATPEKVVEREVVEKVVEKKPKRESKEKEPKVDVQESHEKKERKSVSVEKAEDGSHEKTVEVEQLAERKVKQQVEEGENYKVETTEVVVTKKQVMVSEETHVINGGTPEEMEKLEALAKSMRIAELDSPNTDSGVSSVIAESSSMEISSTATDAEDSTIVIERSVTETKTASKKTEQRKNSTTTTTTTVTAATESSNNTTSASTNGNNGTKRDSKRENGANGGNGGANKNNRGKRKQRKK